MLPIGDNARCSCQLLPRVPAGIDWREPSFVDRSRDPGTKIIVETMVNYFVLSLDNKNVNIDLDLRRVLYLYAFATNKSTDQLAHCGCQYL